MSLDVYLISKTKTKKIPTAAIFIRENGKTFSLTPEEWNERYPDNTIPIEQNEEEIETDIMFHRNITHNLGKMAAQADLYYALWRPEELVPEVSLAADLIPYLESGLDFLKDGPDFYKSFNPENGWGDYEGLVEFVENYLKACKQYPDCEINVSR